MIRGLRGARKARFPLPGRGKSGGGRTVYYVAVAPGVLFMMTAYPKNERDDLSPEQRKAILEAIASIKGVEP
ncbi:MAG UNVERIFIED_CONTAM: type II toxin-antitoxin system RelE/ParE family toxin [Methylobacterium ajmalii]|nr:MULTISPECIES: type II toxin-antitoxin system RelE/ParE family toxin [Methylobacterium]MBZ6416399.1 type II toxin-antitoxin system RelE/ParE family toxin [Methylobacterium sp.]